ncbi:MAG: hypothetical protein ABDH49_03910 [Candidatus Hydrothermales bacterium]
MAHAYTPGLKVSEKTLIFKERRLPLKGEVIVKKGNYVKAEDVVARTLLPGNVHPVNVAGLLGVSPTELPNFMIKKEGQEVKKDEVIAISKGFFGLFKTEVKSPVDGKIEQISLVTGQVIIREPPIPVEVKAYFDGVVEEIIPEEGVIMKTTATFIQGIFGVGGEKIGKLKVLVDSPDEELKIDKLARIGDDSDSLIVVGGSFITAEVLKKLEELNVVGCVVGGIDDENLRKFLGYDIGVAITGSEPLKITLILTEGFGRLEMAKRTFELLKKREGEKCSINGATQIRAGVIRPEIIIPYKEIQEVKEEDTLKEGLAKGTIVRIIRDPYFGEIGKVVSLPPELRVIDTESKVRILEVELKDGRRVTVPRANVEIIET